VTSAAAAEAEASRLGFPVAMKLHGQEVAHKSEVGGVLLGVADPAQVRAGFEELRERGRRAGLEEAAVLVERQMGAGVELIVGGQNDPRFGPVLMVGAGGILTEVLQDAAHRLAPVDREEALEMLAELRTGALLDGYRGAPGIDRESVADVVVAVGDLLTELPRVRELDLNPILPGPGGRGCVAVDALVVLADGDEEGR
ncbi:MAG: acetate--CoA ligase family protein, partial [Candidatus Dormibacteraeota bacterium]|nr:acetate--CoA ligase family protein [Candidatus Dormibacteraeota bacterium]